MNNVFLNKTKSLVCLTALLVGSQLQAQESNERAEQNTLEEVIVTGELQKAVKDTALPINVLSGDELREEAASTIGDTTSITKRYRCS